MSKFLSHYMLPGVGAGALAIGLGYGFANRDYAGTKIETLEGQLQEATAQVSSASAGATAEAERATALEARVAELQASFAAGGALTAPAPRAEAAYGLGRAALPEEIAAWDVDVLPDGRGLPEGSGDVLWGEEVFADKCASCHGDFAEGVDNWPVLAGGFDTLADEDPVKTVGSYWPYLSTVWDYVHRSMPFGGAQTLTDDEVYGIVAYILYSNDIVDEDFVLSHENFLDVPMHNAGNFVVDDRAEVEYSMWSAEPCMEDCKDSVEITMRASVLDVTPEEEGGEEAVMAVSADTGAAEAEPVAEPVAVAAVSLDPELVKDGKKVFKKCKACHQIGEGAKSKTGPHLNGIVGRPFAELGDFKYSKAFDGSEARVWDAEALKAFLSDPKGYLPGTKMSFRGLKKEADLEALLAYLQAEGG